MRPESDLPFCSALSCRSWRLDDSERLSCVPAEEAARAAGLRRGVIAALAD